MQILYVFIHYNILNTKYILVGLSKYEKFVTTHEISYSIYKGCALESKEEHA